MSSIKSPMTHTATKKRQAMQVQELMTRRVHVCDTRDTLERAAQIMWDHDCGTVPVIDGHGRLVGMLTDRDCCMAAYTQGKPLSQIPVVDVISHSVCACEPETSIEHAQRTMAQHAIRRLPVVNTAGKLVGILTLGDLALASTPQQQGQAADADQVALTLAAVCEHEHNRHA
jgi:CBS domain-containing protein